jgi:hypothetical protein
VFVRRRREGSAIRVEKEVGGGWESVADNSRSEEPRAEVVARVKGYLPTDELQFLMELSIDPVAARDSRDGI